MSARSKKDNLGLVAAGVAFYGMLAVFPAIIAAVSVYALVADPSTIKSQLDPLIKTLPPGGGDLLVGQLTATASSSHGGVSIGVIIGIVGTLFAASGGVRALMTGLNVIFERTESRNFIKLLVFSLALTLGALVIGIVALALIAAFPVVLDHIGLGAFAAVLAQIGRWIALLVVIGGSLALFYQYGTDRGAAATVHTSALASWSRSSSGSSARCSSRSTSRTSPATTRRTGRSPPSSCCCCGWICRPTPSCTVPPSTRRSRRARANERARPTRTTRPTDR